MIRMLAIYDGKAFVDELNAGGHTLFLEPNADWVRASNAKDLRYVAYNELTW